MKVAFRPLAQQDLRQLGDLIARTSRPNAAAFVARLRRHCMNLAEFPLRGRSRPDFGPQIRSVSFEGRVTIPYRIEGDAIVIVRILYAGRDFEA